MKQQPKQQSTQQSTQQRTTRQWGASMSGDLLLQAGFPVVREANGNLVADVRMITGRKNVPQTNVASASKQSDDPEGFPLGLSFKFY